MNFLQLVESPFQGRNNHRKPMRLYLWIDYAFINYVHCSCGTTKNLKMLFTTLLRHVIRTLDSVWWLNFRSVHLFVNFQVYSVRFKYIYPGWYRLKVIPRVSDGSTRQSQLSQPFKVENSVSNYVKKRLIDLNVNISLQYRDAARWDGCHIETAHLPKSRPNLMFFCVLNEWLISSKRVCFYVLPASSACFVGGRSSRLANEVEQKFVD